MSEQWQVDIARSESDRKLGRVEVAAYTCIGFDRRTVASVDRLEDARQIVADHTAALAQAERVVKLEAALDTVLRRECLGCSDGAGEHWQVCQEVRAALARPAAQPS